MSTIDLQALLRDEFGFESFRPGQERIVRDLLDGRDVLAVLPTGAGKSLTFQLTAQLVQGITLVVSPLLALMKDQVHALAQRGLPAASVSGSPSDRQIEHMLASAQDHGGRMLVYVTPERFENEEFLADLRRLRVGLFVVDEAHSISEWGHTFRPSYLTLNAAIERFDPRPVVLALTATASPWIRNDIVERLRLRNPDVVVRDVDRPNLFLEVERVEEEWLDQRVLRRLLVEQLEDSSSQFTNVMQGSGIVYTATTRAAEETAEWLREWGIAADFYHGQRKKADRDRVQDDFMSGTLRVIAATNAFGLGIDKPDVRFVIHRDIPPNLESYYQEAGRAGRDGQVARCTLIYRPGDLGRASFLAGGVQLSREHVVQAHAGLVQQRARSVRELEAATGLGKAHVVELVALLAAQGLVEVQGGDVALRVADFDPQVVPLDREEHRRAYERSRLDMMRGYAELRECRRRYILNYFGEEYSSERCNWCDVDLARPAHEEHAPPPRLPLAVGDRVAHRTWGYGVVERVTTDTFTVLFDAAGYKTLAADIVLQQDLLRKR